MDYVISTEKLEADDIIPQIVSKAPPNALEVTYKAGKVSLGNELTPLEVNDEPQVKWNAAPEKFYTLILVDPDAPSKQNPTFADVKHWLVANIPGSDVAEGDVIAEYYGSGPPKNTGLHRYIFLIYEQKEKQIFDEPRSLKLSRGNRLKWSLNNFVEKNNLGQPFALNYFKAQWEPFVDERNKHISNN